MESRSEPGARHGNRARVGLSGPGPRAFPV